MKLSSRIITIDRTPIFLGKELFFSIDRFVNTLTPNGIFILVDPNSKKYCLPLLLAQSSSLDNSQVMDIGDGESSKSIENAEKIWNELLIAGADRHSLLINLGGGVVSDLGGFIAAGFKRGINYINIPTTLMGQADAAIGGKTAVNFGNIKNQIGFFYSAKAVFIFPGFLKTLPEEHLRSGLAEIIKSALIGDAVMWHRLTKTPVNALLREPVENGLWFNLISGAVKYKNRVAVQDYHELNKRKVLNFGHTIGHALEGYSHRVPGRPLLHGEAVAAGMICAAYLSHRKTSLPLADLDAITNYITDGFPKYTVDASVIPEILELMMHDKKNQNGRFQFTLLKKTGSPLINQTCDWDEILEAIEYYNAIQ